MMTFTIEELKRLEAEATPGEWDVSGLTVYDTCMDGVASTHSAADAALIVAMCNALPDLLKALEWQPIETAPRNGTNILLFDDGANPEIFVGFGERLDPGEGTAWIGIDCYLSFNPTHWMPLPLPPHGGVDVG